MTNTFNGEFSDGLQDPSLGDTQLFASFEEQFKEIEQSIEQLSLETRKLCTVITYQASPALEEMDILLYRFVKSDTTDVSVESIIRSSGQFIEKIAKMINFIGMGISKLLMTGFPFFNKIIKRAGLIKERALKTEESTGTIDKRFKMMVIDDTIASPDRIVDSFKELSEISKDLLSKEKLKWFQRAGENILHPFHSIQNHKLDEVCFIIGVLAILSNPAIPAGMLLKKLGGAIAPKGVGQAVDVAVVAASIGISQAVLGGMGLLIPTLGQIGKTMLRDFIKGRIKIDSLPRYHEVYPFCTNELRNGSIFDISESNTLLGNRYFEVKDFKEVISGDLKCSADDTGAKFKTRKVSHELSGEHEPLSPEQVVQLCDTIVQMLTEIKGYARSFPQMCKVYNDTYSHTSEVFERGFSFEGKLAEHYVHYSYRHAMNMIVDGVWKNCFGSDNQFIRYLVKLSRETLTYCEQSLGDRENDPEE